jgi:prevent-host-death family protein
VRYESYGGPTVDNRCGVVDNSAMRQVSVTDLKTNFAAVVKAVAEGQTIELTRYGRPVARLVPPTTEPRLLIRPALRPFSDIAHKRYPPVNLPVSSLDLLVEERGQR